MDLMDGVDTMISHFKFEIGKRLPSSFPVAIPKNEDTAWFRIMDFMRACSNICEKWLPT